MIPEANDAVSFPLNQCRTPCIPARLVLASIDLDDQHCPMACEIGDEMSDRYLTPKSRF
jgi:hypothetical protein